MALQAVVRGSEQRGEAPWSVKWSVQRRTVSKSRLDRARRRWLTSGVIFYGLATWQCQSVEEFFLTRDEAENCLRRMLADEPEWIDVVGLVRLDFSGEQPKIEVLA